MLSLGLSKDLLSPKRKGLENSIAPSAQKADKSRQKEIPTSQIPSSLSSFLLH